MLGKVGGGSAGARDGATGSLAAETPTTNRPAKLPEHDSAAVEGVVELVGDRTELTALNFRFHRGPAVVSLLNSDDNVNIKRMQSRATFFVETYKTPNGIAQRTGIPPPQSGAPKNRAKQFDQNHVPSNSWARLTSKPLRIPKQRRGAPIMRAQCFKRDR